MHCALTSLYSSLISCSLGLVEISGGMVPENWGRARRGRGARKAGECGAGGLGLPLERMRKSNEVHRKVGKRVHRHLPGMPREGCRWAGAAGGILSKAALAQRDSR